MFFTTHIVYVWVYAICVCVFINRIKLLSIAPTVVDYTSSSSSGISHVGKEITCLGSNQTPTV